MTSALCLLLPELGFAQSQAKRPNILLIVADDMGYSDFEPFGGEIKTPYLSSLAKRGISFYNFYTSPLCAPSRAMLLSGVDNHLSGLGAMFRLAENQKGMPGYEMHLNKNVVTIATLLKDHGYQTYMAGKWHLGRALDLLPHARGFTKSFTISNGPASHFVDASAPKIHDPFVTYYENGKQVHKIPKDFYSSKFFTDKLISYLETHTGAEPFFAYLSFTAPHDPLHIPDDWADKYKGRYDEGYEALRLKRKLALQTIGAIPASTQLSALMPDAKPWNSLSERERKISARKMEVYAAMISYMDNQIGRLFHFLKSRDQLENTLIIFISDNGAAGGETFRYSKRHKGARGWFNKRYDNRLENIGRPGSAVAVGRGWAQASMSPFKFDKGKTSEGGIRAPFIVAGPHVTRHGFKDFQTIAHIMDIPVTIYKLAGVTYQQSYNGRDLHKLQGLSLLDAFAGRQVPAYQQRYLAWELHGHRGVRKNNWKLLGLKDHDWKLYNLSTDPGETHDLSKTHPDIVSKLKGYWADYTLSNNVIEPNKKGKW